MHEATALVVQLYMMNHASGSDSLIGELVPLFNAETVTWSSLKLQPYKMLKNFTWGLLISFLYIAYFTRACVNPRIYIFRFSFCIIHGVNNSLVCLVQPASSWPHDSLS